MPCAMFPALAVTRPLARALAATLSGRAGNGKVVCVVSGGNINLGKLAEILNGATS